MSYYKIDRGDGVLVSAQRDEWQDWFAGHGNRVEATKTPDGALISTVCLGIDHAGFWYETCVFRGDDSEVVERYTTRVEAVEGHERWEHAVLEGGAL